MSQNEHRQGGKLTENETAETVRGLNCACLIVEGGVRAVRPARVLHGQPPLVGPQSELKHPLWLLLLGTVANMVVALPFENACH